MNILDIEIPNYNAEENPTTKAESAIIDWTIDRQDVMALEKIYKAKCKGVKKKRNLVKMVRKSSEVSEQYVIKHKRNKSEISLNTEFKEDDKSYIKIQVITENGANVLDSNETNV